MWQYNYTDELYHAGVKGMKWGRRKARPTSGSSRSAGRNADANDEAARKKKVKRAVVIGAAAAGTLVAAYGAYKVSRFVKNNKTIGVLRSQKNDAWKNMQKIGASAKDTSAMLKSYNDQIANIYKNRWR